RTASCSRAPTYSASSSVSLTRDHTKTEGRVLRTRPSFRSSLLPSEVELTGDLHVPRWLNPRRRQPGAARHEPVVLREDHVRVREVVEIQRNLGACSAVPKNLRHAEIDVVLPCAIERARLGED